LINKRIFICTLISVSFFTIGCFESSPTSTTTSIKDTLVIRDTIIKIDTVKIIKDSGSTKSDNLQWILSSFDPSVEIKCSAFGNGMFIAAGVNWYDSLASAPVFTSFDGITWQRNSKGIEKKAAAFTKVSWVHDRFFLFDIAKNITYTSKDGINWENINASLFKNMENNVSKTLNNIVYGNDIFIALISAYDTITNEVYNKITKSSDGLNWATITIHNYQPNNHINIFPLSFANGSFYSLWSDENKVTHLLSSVNGTDWKNEIINLSTNLFEFNYVNNKFIGISSDCQILSSSDCKIWTKQPIFPRCFSTISASSQLAWDGKQDIIVNGDGSILFSKDLQNWSLSITSLPGISIIFKPSLTYGNHRFVYIFYNIAYIAMTN
jgi:hypothetical protein